MAEKKSEELTTDGAFGMGILMTLLGIFIVGMLMFFGYSTGFSAGEVYTIKQFQNEAVYLKHAHWERVGESQNYNFKWNNLDDTD